MTWVENLPDHFVDCRSMRHAWKRESFAAASDEELSLRYIPRQFNQVIKRELTCMRCGTNKVEFFGRSIERLRDFERFSVNYSYPDNYLWNKKRQDGDKPTNRDANREMFLRVTIPGG